MKTCSGRRRITWVRCGAAQLRIVEHHSQQRWDSRHAQMQWKVSSGICKSQQEHQDSASVTGRSGNRHLFVAGIRYNSCHRNVFSAADRYRIQVESQTSEGIGLPSWRSHFVRATCGPPRPRVWRSLIWAVDEWRMTVPSDHWYCERRLLAPRQLPRCKLVPENFGLLTMTRCSVVCGLGIE